MYETGGRICSIKLLRCQKKKGIKQVYIYVMDSNYLVLKCSFRIIAGLVASDLVLPVTGLASSFGSVPPKTVPAP